MTRVLRLVSRVLVKPSRLAALGAMLLLMVSGPISADQPRAARQIAVVPIEGVINDVLARSIERRVAEARAAGATTIVFQLNTPGGLVTSALSISRSIKSLPKEIHTVAWVKNEALSAGALISVACREIVMSSASTIGDCAPIMISPVGGLEELGDAERAKAESPVLQDFRDSAARNGYDALLCRAMVSVGEEVWWIERINGGERRFVDTAEKKRLIDAVEEGQRAWRLATSYLDPVSGAECTLIQPIDNATQLVTLSQSEAVAFGLASAIVSDEAGLREHILPQASVVRYEISAWEHFALWLNSPLVRGIVFVIMIVGAYIEFQSPGLLIPGGVALLALGVFLGAPYAAGLADIWTIILLVLGVVLLAVEIFILPGFGVAGIAGIVLILGSLLGTFIPREPGAPLFSVPNMQATWDALKTGILVLSTSLIASSVGIVLLARYLPQLAVSRGLISSNPNEPTTPPVVSSELVGLEGDVGVVVAPLRPGGLARFGAHVIEVHSQGDYIDNGTRVQVLRREGMTVYVRSMRAEA